jgi:hypothetical protein
MVSDLKQANLDKAVKETANHFRCQRGFCADEAKKKR